MSDSGDLIEREVRSPIRRLQAWLAVYALSSAFIGGCFAFRAASWTVHILTRR